MRSLRDTSNGWAGNFANGILRTAFGEFKDQPTLIKFTEHRLAQAAFDAYGATTSLVEDLQRHMNGRWRQERRSMKQSLNKWAQYVIAQIIAHLILSSIFRLYVYCWNSTYFFYCYFTFALKPETKSEKHSIACLASFLGDLLAPLEKSEKRHERVYQDYTEPKLAQAFLDWAFTGKSDEASSACKSAQKTPAG